MTMTTAFLIAAPMLVLWASLPRPPGYRGGRFAEHKARILDE